MKKKIIIISLIALLLVIGLIILIICIKKDKESTIKPYVEENNIKVVSSKDEFKIPFEPYAKDKTDKSPIDIDGVNFEDTIGIYKFYGYSESDVDEDNYVTYSFKYDVVVPISYTIDTSKLNNTNWYRSYAFLQASVFDYYTGELYREKNISVTGNLNFHNINDVTDDMAYTNITWNDKEYKIGVRMESSSKWDGVTKVNSTGSIDTYNDTHRLTMIGYIYVPKDYDGVMVSLNKNGTSKDIVLKQIEFNNRYNELIKEEENKKEKSNELTQMENKLNKMYKLLDTQYMDTNKRNNNDFYVIRVNEISKD